MDAMKGLLVRLRALLHRREADRDLDHEIRFHIAMETERNRAAGMSEAEARRRALVAFGGVERVREEHRDARGVRWLEELAGDTRYALRTMARTPALTGAALVTLALGVGANTAIFSAVNAVILQPLPFPAPERLVMLWEENPEKGWYKNVVAPANMLDWREQVPAFDDVAGYASFQSSKTLTGEGEPRLLEAAVVTGNFFSLLGVRPAAGRLLRDEETWRTGEPVAVMSHRLWRDLYGADPAIVGRTIDLDGERVQIVGVAGEGFAFPADDVDFWVPTAWNPASPSEIWFRRAHWMLAIARLAPGVTHEQANAQLQQVVERLKREYPETNRYMGAGMTPLHEFLIGDTRLPLLTLLGGAVLLLLIACANVGNLLLVRAAGRQREMTLRTALGAGRMRLVRQAMTESLVLSASGGALGLALGWWGTGVLVAMQPEGMLRVREFGIDWAVVGYVLAITTASGVLFGLAPALWSGRRHPAAALRDGAREGQSRRARRWGDALVVGEVALALLLTVGAGLLLRSYRELRRVDPGFDPTGVLATRLALPDGRYDSEDKAQAFYEMLRERAAALPGVESAALAREIPLTRISWTGDFIAAGRAPDDYGSEVVHRSVSPEYFRAMRVPILRGRPLTPDDRQDAPRVLVINDALAQTYFRGEDPVGQRIAFTKAPDSTTTWWTIIGVAGSEHQASLATPPQIELLKPFAQSRSWSMSLILRTAGDPLALAPSIRDLVAGLDPLLAIVSIRTMSDVHAMSLARERFLTTLLLIFAIVGLVLAVVGVYGVLAQITRARTREMGIRIALGAQGAQVRWLVIRHGLRLTAVGVAIGAAGALLATRGMEALLFGVPAADPMTFLLVAALLTATSFIAAWLPAARASRADPAITLRGD